MHVSYGEAGLVVDSYHCGTVRVLGIHAQPALYPRMGILLGWVLREIPAHESGPYKTLGLNNYQVVDLMAELRIGRGGAGSVVGQLWLARGTIEIRSSPYHSEDHVTLACNLDLARLERLEGQRNGDRLHFSIILWPTVIRDGKRVRGTEICLDFQVPQDDWLNFLTAVQFGEYEVLEIKRPAIELDAFQDVRDQLALARARINHGEYNSAATAVRTALERTIQQARDG